MTKPKMIAVIDYKRCIYPKCENIRKEYGGWTDSPCRVVCATQHDPPAIDADKAVTWICLDDKNDENVCTGCGECVKACPVGAIALEEKDGEG